MPSGFFATSLRSLVVKRFPYDSMIGACSLNALSEKAFINVRRMRVCVCPSAVNKESAPFIGGVVLNGSLIRKGLEV